MNITGLRHIPLNQDHLVQGSRVSLRNYHDHMSYERGFIQHSRSPNNQLINYHFLFGGFRTYILQRFLVQTIYRRNVRIFWFPVLLGYTFCCVTMRMYDNACYDYFYFSD
ncbi:hypothetical protein IMG5_094500 [Ichthyophthirius multifiliis]|uniref:Transmembrane protein n=1 Tax=Ichthyophthirius multifiliis TaxID=5932 RepID=G0QRK0_ICHMU|nr:hypothetical protein IMG5_094500 [Ichthyophthirius multifiliis]EGR32154.1 hypothetical protein IMG5_094500 [Ichthyophthirius multifiliis]|eukprot:XP_004035640.1 hypothetical protein IMG5_094500 [Ichthyophthirius multifiliis]